MAYVYGFRVVRASPIWEKVTLKPVTELSHASHVTGPPKHFTTAQVDALRQALREINQREKARADLENKPWNQSMLGDLVGVSQQVAGRYLGPGQQGMSMPTGVRVAKLCGYESLDEFFEERLDQPVPVERKTEGMRDLAVTLARRMNIAPEAINAVLSRYDSREYDNRPAKWWVGKFIDEDKDLPPLPTPTVSQQNTKPKISEEPKKTKRRRVA